MKQDEDKSRMIQGNADGNDGMAKLICWLKLTEITALDVVWVPIGYFKILCKKSSSLGASITWSEQRSPEIKIAVSVNQTWDAVPYKKGSGVIVSQIQICSSLVLGLHYHSSLVQEFGKYH